MLPTPRPFTLSHSISGHTSPNLEGIKIGLMSLDVDEAITLYEHEFGQYPRITEEWGTAYKGLVTTWTDEDWRDHFAKVEADVVKFIPKDFEGKVFIDYESMNLVYDALSKTVKDALKAAHPMLTPTRMRQVWEYTATKLVTDTLAHIKAFLLQNNYAPAAAAQVGIYGWPDWGPDPYWSRQPWKSMISVTSVLNPCCYLRADEDIDSWIRRNFRTMNAAMEIGERLVYPDLSPYDEAGNLISGYNFGLQLASLQRFGAAGAVVWSHSNSQPQADEVADWWAQVGTPVWVQFGIPMVQQRIEAALRGG